MSINHHNYIQLQLITFKNFFKLKNKKDYYIKIEIARNKHNFAKIKRMYRIYLSLIFILIVLIYLIYGFIAKKDSTKYLAIFKITAFFSLLWFVLFFVFLF